MFHEDDYEDTEVDTASIELEEVLKELLDEAVKRGIIEDSIGYRDLFDTKLMNCLLPRPAQVQETFARKYEKSPKEATDFYYKFSQDSDYIRRYRVKKDMKWKVASPYQAGEGSQGNRSGQERKVKRLSQVSALHGK